jgi:hypothetical protein
VRTDRRTDIHDKIKSRFSGFCEKRLKIGVKVLQILNFSFARLRHNQTILCFFFVEYLPEDGIKGSKHVGGLANVYISLYLIIVQSLE